MANTINFRKAFWILIILIAIYPAALLLLTLPYIQRHALYVHLFNTKWWQDPNEPEQFGFPKHQVTPFNIPTPDGELLYAWHVLPPRLHEQEMNATAEDIEEGNHSIGKARLGDHVNRQQFERTRAFQLLTEDPEALLVISFHGNAGTVSQGWRPACYRNIASLDRDHIHVIAIDYRGFGYSTGSPTEQGLITDAIATLRYALDVIKIPSERIVIIGQSLGTAVSVAVAEYFHTNEQIDFQGIVLVAPFTDLPSLVLDYKIGGMVPILSPLKRYPRLQQYFASYIRDEWQTIERVKRLASSGDRLNLHLLHAQDDHEIPWQHSKKLFEAVRIAGDLGSCYLKVCAVGASEDGTLDPNVPWPSRCESHDSQTGGEGTRLVDYDVLTEGGHNRITTSPIVAKAIMHAFKV